VQSTTTGCGFTTTPRAYDDATPALKSVLARKRGLVDEYRQSESSSTHTARLDASANVRRTSERSPSSTSFRTCTEAGRERRSGRPLYIVVVERISRGKERCVGFLWYYPAVPGWEGIRGPTDSSGSLFDGPFSFYGPSFDLLFGPFRNECSSRKAASCGSEVTEVVLGIDSESIRNVSELRIKRSLN